MWLHVTTPVSCSVYFCGPLLLFLPTIVRSNEPSSATVGRSVQVGDINSFYILHHGCYILGVVSHMLYIGAHMYMLYMGGHVYRKGRYLARHICVVCTGCPLWYSQFL